MMKLTNVWVVSLLAMLSLQGYGLAEDSGNGAEIDRLILSHDPDVMVAVGRLYVKQTGLRAIRSLLSEQRNTSNLDQGWNESATEWQAAENELIRIVDSLIARQIENSQWLLDGWRPVFAKVLTPEEAGYVADHLATEIGKEQRNVYEVMLIGETLLANYSYTGRIKYGEKGSERELKKMQDVWYVRKAVQLRDFEKHPEALKFGASPAGVRYVRALQVSGISAIIAHFDAVGLEVEQAVRNAKESVVVPRVDAYRARRAGVK